MLPTVALALLAAAIQPRLLWFAGALTATFTINLTAVYIMAHDARGAPFFDRHDPRMTLLALVNIGLFVWFLARGLREIETEPAPLSRRVLIYRDHFVRAK